MRHRAYALLFSAVFATPLTAAPVEPFQFKYSVIRNGGALGIADMQYRALPNDVWRFTSKTVGTEGLAKIAGASISEDSTLLIRNERIDLYSNRLDTKVAWKTSTKTVKLQSDGKSYLYTDSKGIKSVPYKPGIIDIHSLTIALMADLAAGKGPSLVYSTFNKGKVEPYTFKVIGKQTLNTALGKINTVRVDRIRQSSGGKSSHIYFAVDKKYAPVLIQELNSEGDDIEMKILSIK